MGAGPAWLERRDPGLLTLRRALRVAIAASVGFYLCRYALDNAILATYALFSTIALGFLSQIPGPAVRRAGTLLLSLPAAAVLITVASLIAGNLWVASAGMLVFGFLIAFAGVGGPRLVGLAAGMQLLFILPGFPPYALDTLPSRLGGLAVGVGLLTLAELWLWPDPAPVKVQDRLATAAEALGSLLAARGAGQPDSNLGAGHDDRTQHSAGGAANANLAGGGAAATGWTLDAAEAAAEAIRPSRLPSAARPASAGRHDRALSHASSLLRYAMVRLRQLPFDPPPPPAAADLLACAARGAAAAAASLRGGPLPETTELARAFAGVRRERRESPPQPVPGDAEVATLAMVVGDAVWAMVTAVRVAQGGRVEVGHGGRKVRQERFPYAYASQLRLWWERFAVHLTPRSVYFQQAVRVAVALAVARVVAGALELQHGFWVLLATLTLLRSRAADTRIALLPAVIGTVAGAVVAGIVLFLIGNNTGVYAALLPPVMVLAFAAGVIGPAWGQAMFTVAITFVFSQLAPASVSLAEVRLTDVLLGAVIGVATGVLAWPHGAAGELRRSTANFLAIGGDLVRWTAADLTTPRRAPPRTASARPATDDQPGGAHQPATGGGPAIGDQPATKSVPADPTVQGSPVPAVAAVPDGQSIEQVKEIMALADASYSMYQAERHSPAESKVDWQAVLVAGHHIVRGSELLRDSFAPGTMAPWRDLVDDSANRVERACDQLADAIREGNDPRADPPEVAEAPDGRVVDVQVWLAGVRDDLVRVGRAPPDSTAVAP